MVETGLCYEYVKELLRNNLDLFMGKIAAACCPRLL